MGLEEKRGKDKGAGEGTLGLDKAGVAEEGAGSVGRTRIRARARTRTSNMLFLECAVGAIGG